jgi:hypothetical protein
MSPDLARRGIARAARSGRLDDYEERWRIVTESDHRELDTVRDQFLLLHHDVGELATNVFKYDVPWRPWTIKYWWRRPPPLVELERRFDEHFTTFMRLDAALIARAEPPSTYTPAGVAFRAIKFQMYFGVRDSVRGLLSDTNGAIGSLRNQADFRLALTISVLAIFVALVSALADIGLLEWLRSSWSGR